MGQFHWDPAEYLELMRREVPDYERLQTELVAATGPGAGADAVRTVLELGTGTGETARRVLDAHPGARLHGIDASADMLDMARASLAGRPVTLAVARIEEGLPPGPFDLVVSALAVHHLDGPGKRGLFASVAAALAAEGRFVLADVVIPEDPADAITPIDPSYDLPSTVADQLGWLRDAGLQARVAWSHNDLAVLAATR